MIYWFGDCSLDVGRQELRRGADLISVEPKVLDLLTFLIRNRERVVSKDDLIAHVWQGRIVSESTLTSRITAARQAIGDSGEHQRLVRTVARKGLRFVGDVREERDGTQERAAVPVRAPVQAPNAAPRTSERRPITILHCRVGGLMPLSARLEPEDLGEALAACHGCIRDIVESHKGHVAKASGDEVQAYFGYLQADEDDAERAVQASLAIAATVGGLKIKAVSEPLQVCVGVATGLVVVGEAMAGEGVAPTVGETPFLAATLLNLARPGQVVVSAGTQRLLGKLFESRRVDSAPIEAFEILRQGAVESRFEALDRWGSSSLVGRDEEFELLVRRWEQIQEGSGRVVCVIGEPGIGKSRLVQALRDRIGAGPMQIVFHCSPHHQDSAFHPVIGRLTRACQIEREDSAEEKLAKLEALLAQSGAGDPGEVALLASLLSIPAGGRFPLPGLAPRALRERTFAALLAYLQRMAALTPLLVVFEDVHWIDPTSLELLSLMVDQAPAMRLLIVATYRPEFKPPWASSRHISTVLLGRLGRDEGHALVAGIARGKALPADVLGQILDRTDGIPLYIEELSKSVLESGLLRDNSEVAGSLNALSIPSTLHASLAARLDRLGAGKDVAQIGAAIGRRFSYAQIAAVAGLSDTELQARLARLVAAELIYERGTPPEAAYQFKHALVQEAAYASLVRGRRQQLHGEIAQALERQFPDLTLTEPETLAYHLTEAGLADRALEYWLKAGQRAAARSADREAVGHLQRGIALLQSLPESRGRDRIELDFLIALGTPLSSVLGYANVNVGAAAERAAVLAERLNDPASLFAPLYAHYTYLYITGKTKSALQLAERLHALGLRQGDRVMQMMANRAMGVVLSQVGEFSAGRKHYEQALSLHHPEQDAVLATRFLTDPFASTSALLSISLWICGYPERAARMSAQALDFAARLNHVHTGGLVHHFAAHLEALSGNAAGVLAHAQAMSDLATQHNVQAWRIHWIIWEGWARGRLGQHEQGIALMREGIAIQDSRSQTYHVAYYTSLLAQLYARAGDIEQALSRSAEARERAQRAEEQFWRAELDRTEGELRLIAGHAKADIERCFASALELSRRQGTLMFELRAATSLARVWHDDGRDAEARALLTPVYGRFTEGEASPDLIKARALLDRMKAEA